MQQPPDIMAAMKIAGLLVLAYLAAGCGGLGDQCAGGNIECAAAKGSVTVGFDAQTVEPGRTTLVQITQTGYVAASYSLTIKEGSAGGTLSPTNVAGPANGLQETYTAPSAPGIYHVVGTVVDTAGKAHSGTASVAVAVVP